MQKVITNYDIIIAINDRPYVRGGKMDENTKYICDMIRNTVSALDAGRALGLSPGHDGRCKCFFHGGDHRNLRLYAGNRGYYCFVCHAYGDVISLVKAFHNCSFTDALCWLNDSFGLNLNLNKGSFYNRRRRAESYSRKFTGGNVRNAEPAR